MKKGSKKLFCFELFIIMIILLNNFELNILNDYLKLLFMGVLLIVFKFLFGFTKDRHYKWKSVCIEIIIYLLIFFIFYYLLGIIMSFSKTNSYNTFVFIKMIISITLIVIIKEILRYMILAKTFDNRLLWIITCIMFINIDLIGRYDIQTFSTKYNIFVFVSTILLPIISQNVLCTYLSYKVGYKPNIMYLLVIELYRFFVPIIPNPNQYIYAIIWLIMPLLILYQMYVFFEKKELIKKDKMHYYYQFRYLIIPIILIVFLVYFVSGYFYYQAIVVASESMENSINKGDVVFIEKVNDVNKIQVNQIIAYRYNKIIVIHRLVKKIMINDETFYYTKGDANITLDNYKITSDMIIGIVTFKIPYIGYPTVWLNEL